MKKCTFQFTIVSCLSFPILYIEVFYGSPRGKGTEWKSRHSKYGFDQWSALSQHLDWWPSPEWKPWNWCLISSQAEVVSVWAQLKSLRGRWDPGKETRRSLDHWERHSKLRGSKDFMEVQELSVKCVQDWAGREEKAAQSREGRGDTCSEQEHFRNACWKMLLCFKYLSTAVKAVLTQRGEWG